MNPRSWEFDTTLHRWEAASAVVVLAAVPQGASDEIDAFSPVKGGFGSVRVTVTLGTSVWTTSVFPDSAGACYVVPVKKSVRVAEGVELGDRVRLRLELVD